MARAPAVTLLTDFGTRDPYVAQLKAVLYAQGPATLEVIDLSHEIEPQNVREAALFVRAAWPRFAPGTIHMVVVDPGVGSARRALAATDGRHSMLAPDNGVLSLLPGYATNPLRAVEIDPLRLGVVELSATFHGRDLFAPAAARLARGATLDEIGRPADGLVHVPMLVPEVEASGVRGEIIHVDRFGNLITNLTRGDLAAQPSPAELCVHLNDRVPLPLVRCYADVAVGIAAALLGSSDLLEIAVRNASAQRLTGARVGDSVWVAQRGSV